MHSSRRSLTRILQSELRNSGHSKRDAQTYCARMVTVTQNVVIVAAAVIGSLLVMVGLNRVWPWQKRHPYNDLIGWYLGVLGTTFAVILGFMLYTVWTSLAEADLNVDGEANALIDVYQLASGLPEPQRTQLQTLARSYVTAVLSQEWPQMAKGVVPEQSSDLADEMWKTAMSVKATSATEINAQQAALAQLSLLMQHGLTRRQQTGARLPNVLWCVLLTGGTLTIISACTFGMESVRLQGLQVFSISLLVSLSLVAIADVHRPFHGLIHVSDDAFRRVQQSMQDR